MAGAGVVCVAFLILCAVIPSLATDYTVGESAGWALGIDYSTWASGKNFVVGDSLAFNYGGGHTVDEVIASDYSTCTVGNAITSDSSGATTVSLKKAGTHYFICGIMGHCGSGMKLAVTVEDGKTSAPPTSSSSATPSSGAATTTSPATTTATPTTVTPTSTNEAHSSAGKALSLPVAVVITWLYLFVLVLS